MKNFLIPADINSIIDSIGEKNHKFNKSNIMNSDITIILTLFKTPKNIIKRTGLKMTVLLMLFLG